MSGALTGGLLAGATVLGGLLAGSNFDRALLAMPAWQQLGPTPWAEFSRRADLGAGLLLYPVEAIGSALLTVAAVVSVQFDAAPPMTLLSLYGAAIFSVGGLLLTIKAAPIMLGIREATDAEKLREAFEKFRYWGNLRAICQILAFLGQVAAVVAWRSSP